MTLRMWSSSFHLGDEWSAERSTSYREKDGGANAWKVLTLAGRAPREARKLPCQLAGEDPGMASSSKGRASSRKQSSAGKARVISTKRKDALPRTGSVSAGGLQQKERTASRKKTTRAAGRASAKLDKPLRWRSRRRHPRSKRSPL
jgi:hypothetical protein